MSKPKSTARLVITSVVISFVVIAVFALVFINFIVPAYQVTEEQIYSVLIRLFPILIGLILIQIGVMIAKRHEDEFADQVDRLPPNAYTKPFESSPKDDPLNVSIDATRTQEQVPPRPVAEAPVREVIREVPVEKEIVREVPVEKVVVKEVPVEVIREIEKEVPVIHEVIKEIPVPSADASPVEIVKEVPVEVIKEVIREVPAAGQVVEKEVPVIKEIIKEVPIEIVKEVPVEVPVEKVVEKVIEKPVEVEKIVEKPVVAGVVGAPAETRMLDFADVLEEECRNAHADSYDITLALFRKGDGCDEDRLEKAFSANAFIFDRGDDYALIFSFANEDEVTSLIQSRQADLGDVSYSLATQSGDNADPERLVKMAAAGF